MMMMQTGKAPAVQETLYLPLSTTHTSETQSKSFPFASAPGEALMIMDVHVFVCKKAPPQHFACIQRLNERVTV